MGIVAETPLEPSQFADVMIAFWKSPTPGQTSYYGKIRTEGQGMLTKGIFSKFRSFSGFSFGKVLVTGSSILVFKGTEAKKRLQNSPHARRVNGVTKTFIR